jgi:hypothetical protein
MGGIPMGPRGSFCIPSRETDRGGTVSDRADRSHQHPRSLLPAPPCGKFFAVGPSRRVLFSEAPCAAIFGCILFCCSPHPIVIPLVESDRRGFEPEGSRARHQGGPLARCPPSGGYGRRPLMRSIRRGQHSGQTVGTIKWATLRSWTGVDFFFWESCRR